MYNDQISYDKDSGRFVTNFLFYDQSKFGLAFESLSDHYFLSIDRNTNLERKLLKNYDKVNIDSMNDEVFRRFETGEFMTYSQAEDRFGRQYWQSLQGYFHPLGYALREKPGHALRLIFDTAVKNKQNKSWNDFCLMGATLNADLLMSLFKVRLARFLAIGDVEKYFNCIQIFPKSAKLCSFLWRKDGLGGSAPWEKSAAFRLEFGFRASPTLSSLCLKKCVEKFSKTPSNKQFANTSLYVDDIFQTSQNIDDLYRDILDVTTSLSQGKFFLKEWQFTKKSQVFNLESFKRLVDSEHVKLSDDVMTNYNNWLSGQSVSDICNSLVNSGQKHRSSQVTYLPKKSLLTNVLGTSLCLINDLLQPRVKFNLSKRTRGCKASKNNITTQNLEYYFVKLFKLTKRGALALCHSVFDPFGLWQILVLTLKFLYQRILIKYSDFNYESVIPEEEIPDWKSAIAEVFEIQKFWYKRPLVPENIEMYNTRPILVGHWDSSTFGQGCVFHLMYEAIDKSHFVGKFLMCKSTIGGLRAHSVPVGEMTSLLLCCELYNAMKKNWYFRPMQ